jgi:hypothetical protein
MGKVKEVDGDVGLMNVFEDLMIRSFGPIFASASCLVCVVPSRNHDQLYNIFVSLAVIHIGRCFGHMP